MMIEYGSILGLGLKDSLFFFCDSLIFFLRAGFCLEALRWRAGCPEKSLKFPAVPCTREWKPIAVFYHRNSKWKSALL